MFVMIFYFVLTMTVMFDSYIESFFFFEKFWLFLIVLFWIFFTKLEFYGWFNKKYIMFVIDDILFSLYFDRYVWQLYWKCYSSYLHEEYVTMFVVIFTLMIMFDSYTERIILVFPRNFIYSSLLWQLRLTVF